MVDLQTVKNTSHKFISNSDYTLNKYLNRLFNKLQTLNLQIKYVTWH